MSALACEWVRASCPHLAMDFKYVLINVRVESVSRPHLVVGFRYVLISM